MNDAMFAPALHPDVGGVARLRRGLLAAGIVLLAAGANPAQAAAPVADSPRAAVVSALRDASAQNPQLVDHSTLLYVWVDSTDPWERAGHVVAANHALSHVSPRIHPRWVKLSAGWLAAWDLRLFADSRERLRDLLKVRELLGDERYFHQPCEGKFLAHQGGGQCRQVKANGKVMQALYLGAEGIALSQLLQTSAPIVRWDNFLARVGSAINHGYGDGLYLKSRGIEGLTFAQALKRVGADATLKTGGDRAIAMSISEITNKPRRGRFVPAARAVVGTTLPVVIWTEDTTDSANADENDIWRNFDTSQFQAIRAFLPMDNGLQETVLADGKGNIVASAPDDVASNACAGTGSRGTRRLHSGFVACGMCHVRESNVAGNKSWFQPVRNDFLALSKELGIFNGNKDALKLTQKYTFDPAPVLATAGELYNRAIDELVVPYVTDDEEDLTGRVWETISERFNSYVHGRIDLKQAVAELGLPESTRRLEFPVFDPIVGLLNAGVSVPRWQFERIFADLSLLAALANGYGVAPYSLNLGLQQRVPGGGFDRGFPRVELRERFDNHLVRELPVNELFILAAPGEQVQNWYSDRKAWLTVGTVRQYGAFRQSVSSIGGTFRYRVGFEGGKFREYKVKLKRGQGYELNFVK